MQFVTNQCIPANVERERRNYSFFPQVLILMTFTLTVPEAAATPDTIQFKLVTDGTVINL